MVAPQASQRWHELYPGLIMELGNLHDNAKGEAQWEYPRGWNPDVLCRGGLTRSSDEASERRSPHEHH